MFYALAAVGLVVLVISVGVLLPMTRPMFMNNHYATVSGAVIASMVIIRCKRSSPRSSPSAGCCMGR